MTVHLFEKFDRKIFGKLFINFEQFGADQGGGGLGRSITMQENRQMEIPDVVRKLMEGDQELKLFVDVLLRRIESLEKQNHELRKQIRRLDKVLEEVIGPDIEERREHGTYIRVRPAPKNQNARQGQTNEAHHKGVTRQVPEKVDIVAKVTTKNHPFQSP